MGINRVKWYMGLFSFFHSEKFMIFSLHPFDYSCSYKPITTQVTFYCKSWVIFSIKYPDIKGKAFSFFGKINQLKLSNPALEFYQNYQNYMLRENGYWGSNTLCLKNRTPALTGWQWAQLKTQSSQPPC